MTHSSCVCWTVTFTFTGLHFLYRMEIVMVPTLSQSVTRTENRKALGTASVIQADMFDQWAECTRKYRKDCKGAYAVESLPLSVSYIQNL